VVGTMRFSRPTSTAPRSGQVTRGLFDPLLVFPSFGEAYGRCPRWPRCVCEAGAV